MWNLNYESVKALQEKLEEHGLAMSKKFGQNFLLPRSIRERIVSSMGEVEGRCVWEIGPGLGAITSILVERKARLKAFEIDHGFASILREEAFVDEDDFTLVEGDALKTLFLETERPDIICGNLPYNVGSVIIASLIENSILPDTMVFTLQKEVVERMTSSRGKDDWSSFSILTQFDYDVRLGFVIGRSNFYPVPNVESATVIMKRKEKSPLEGEERLLFFSMMRDLFAQRRKTVRNNLSRRLGKIGASFVLEKAGLTGMERAEDLEVDTLISLSLAEKEFRGGC